MIFVILSIIAIITIFFVVRHTHRAKHDTSVLASPASLFKPKPWCTPGAIKYNFLSRDKLFHMKQVRNFRVPVLH